MKNFRRIFLLSFTALLFLIYPAKAADKTSLKLTAQEISWLSENKNHIFTMGIDPYTGTEYFKYNNEEKGYLLPLISLIESDLGIKIKLETSKSWSEVFSCLQYGSIDILYGANETPERDSYMSFTRPAFQTPYALIARKNSSISTIGDIDNKFVGFLSNDVVVSMLPEKYKNIKYSCAFFNSQEDGIKALNDNKIDAFITTGGPVVYDYIYRYPDLSYAFKINAVTNDMTFSTLKGNKILAGILDKYIVYLNSTGTLKKIIDQAEIDFNIKIMNLTPSELKWLKNDGTAVVGVTKDYLPFDYFLNGEYKGISGEIIKEISRKTGIKFSYIYGDFDSLAEKLKSGKINVLNIAKTEDRLKFILYPEPYSTERDIIVGKRSSRYVSDILGLEGKRVAVIKGFWHYEYLTKNLTNVDIIETNSIQESMQYVHSGKADYLIENPTVVRYYTEELQLYDLIQKGTTSTSSYLYYGVSMNKPELSSIINKVLPLMDISELTRIGYDEVPHKSGSVYQRRLIAAVIGLGLILAMVILFLIKSVKELIKEKTESELLRQKEHFLYTDSLTELKNRNYFDTKIKPYLDSMQYPQTIIIADMNNLKVVNDNLGHTAGDTLLKCFADLLIKNSPENSSIIRLGGDEFLMIFENMNEIQAENIILNITADASEKEIIFASNQKISPQAALGYATRYSSKVSFESMFKAADEKMYENKKKKYLA